MKKYERSLIALVLSFLLAAVLFTACAKQNDAQQEENSGSDNQRTAASADGVTVSMGEYRVTYRRLYEYFRQTYLSQGLTIDESTQRMIREGAAREALLIKIYIKEAQALGISLTDAEQKACRQSAETQINEITEQYRTYLKQTESYSEADFEMQLGLYYAELGLPQDELLSYLQRTEESELYRQKMEEYYLEQDTPDEETLLRYYRESVEASMYTVDENGEKTPTYTDGQFWNYMKKYSEGHYSPLLYVPEGFLYIDYIEIRAESTAEAEEIVRKVAEGEISFDELQNGKDNADPFRGIINDPYPIGKTDHAQLFTPQAVYTRAEALEIGEIGSYVAQAVTDDDGNTTVTAYLFRRAEGTMCMEGDSGVIRIDCFPETRGLAEENYRIDQRYARQNQWLSDIRYENGIYEN